MIDNARIAKQNTRLPNQECAARNERFVAECLKQINTAPDPEEGLRRLLSFLGEVLECGRVYVFEEMDRQHISNTYEWRKAGVSSGIEQLPYLAKKDLFPWYEKLQNGGNIIEPDVESLRESDPLIYEFLKPQQIRTIVLSPLLAEGKMVGLLGADNPPPEKMEHVSVLFSVLAYFVSSLLSRRELQKLREAWVAPPRPMENAPPRFAGKTVLLVDDSRSLLRLNERVLRPEGYAILSAGSLKQAREILAETRPDAMVLDIDLPDGSGIDFCKELRGSIPVVFLTARSDAQAAKEGIAAGGRAFLTKPYQLEDLQKAVAEAVTGAAETPEIPFRAEQNARRKKEESIR